MHKLQSQVFEIILPSIYLVTNMFLKWTSLLFQANGQWDC